MWRGSNSLVTSANEIAAQGLSKKAENRDLNDAHIDRLWESTLRRRPVFNPADLSRALADLAVSGAQVIAGLAYLEGGDDMVVGSGREKPGKLVNRDFRCSYRGWITGRK